VTTPIVLPWLVQNGLEAAARVLLEPSERSDVDFSRPTDEPALISPHSVSWHVCKNPISLFIGGVAAVIMELAEPRVRTGVWEHKTFRENPILRLRRTGLAAMVSEACLGSELAYGPLAVLIDQTVSDVVKEHAARLRSWGWGCL